MTNPTLLNKQVPLAVCGLILLFVAFIYSQNLSTIKSTHYDDFFTLERSHGFIKQNDWLGVYSSNTLSSKKPPLQYWINAALFKAGIPELFAIRITTFTFYLGIFIIIGLFATALTNGNIWAGAAAMTMVATSTYLLKIARTGLLDQGMIFFILCSLYFLFLAQKNNKAWLLCGLMIGLGALQKNPVALGIISLMLVYLAARRVEFYKPTKLFRDRYFLCGTLVAFTLIVAWPMIQYLRLGPEYLNIYVQEEMLNRFSPLASTAQPAHESDPFRWVQWLRKDIRVFRYLALISLLAILFYKPLRKNPFASGFALLSCAIIAGFAFATGKISWRYSMVLSPFLVLTSVLALNEYFKARQIGVFIVVGLLALSSYDNIEKILERSNTRDKLTPVINAIALLDKYVQENDYIVYDRDLIPGGAYGFYGASPKRYSYFSSTKERDALAKHIKNPALIGVIRETEIDVITSKLPNAEIITTENGITVWRHTKTNE